MARKLSDSQLKALLDILVHTATYHEIEDFKAPDAILQYGRPFQGDDIKPRTPILQALFTEFALPLPGLNAAASIFWPDRVLPLIKALSAANLSESYDKGVLGQRKTVATAISVLLEYPARGYFGGFEREPLAAQDREYDANNPDDLEIAWSNFLQQAVYVDLVDEEFKMVAETPNLSDHSSLIQATHRYIVLKYVTSKSIE